MSDYDLAVIGGGINGVGIARDAAGRGLRVLLLEQDDLAAATSSASTKLIHGGLRYLEHGAFRLVHEALVEREVLLRIAPHLVRPMRFVLPHHAGLRPAWMLRLGLFLYDHIGGRKLLPPTRSLDLAHDPLGAPLRPVYARGFEYSDCQVDDARLVVLNAVDAAARGAAIRTRTRCVGAVRRAGRWELAIEAEGSRDTASARALVNAAGPWVAHVNADVLRIEAPARVRLVKGSHIVVRRLYEHDRAYLFQNADGRVVFAIPYEQDFTLIGTTDIDYDGDPAAVATSSEEIDYLCRTVSDYFRAPVTPAAVVWTYAGVRPLYDDGASKAKDATRDYVLTLDAPGDAAPALIVYGGKITTYRRLAEEALGKLARVVPMGRAWTATAPLPGGDIAWDGIAAFAAQCRARWPFLAEAHALRLARAYGSRVTEVLGDGADASAPAVPGGAITVDEVRYLMRREWAATPDDILWRRSKLGLHLDAEAKSALAALMNEEGGGCRAAQ
jgi:glycerol-3-phosphate dehydrogenase